MFLGYGEDALTFWALNKIMSNILKDLEDQSKPSDCVVFYRPSFGRGGNSNAIFGEFDSILASLENTYLIESKWDNHKRDAGKEIGLTPTQILRHKIFSWYYDNWNLGVRSWNALILKKIDFREQFQYKDIAPIGSLLAQNLEFVLDSLSKHYGTFSCKLGKLRNVILYFYDGNKSKEKKLQELKEEGIHFEIINIDYGKYGLNNFFRLL